MSKVAITETVLRDAHQSLLATRMRTADMLPICEQLDDIGFWSLEVWGGATFDSCIRFLGEDPWERLRQLREALPNTRLQMLLRGQNLVGYRHYADDVVRLFVERAAANGIDVFRIFDALNDNRNLQVAIEAVKAVGRHAQGAICYTTGPVYDTARFVAQARELEAMGCDSICIKDMAGLLTPWATAELVRALGDAVSLPLHLHCHATSGLAELCQLKAVEAGCLQIDTACSALAGGTSHPPTESMVAALQGSPFDTGLDLEALQRIGFYFREVREKYWAFESAFTGVDTRVQVNQVPGGMISNLANQLREQNALKHMNAVLAEIPRVRAELGYPPLVTPSSQIVGTQAVLNVLHGERYTHTTNEVRQYLLGHYGHAPGPIDEAVYIKVVGEQPRTEQRPADLLANELPAARERLGGLAESDEDLLTATLFPEVGQQFLQRRRDGDLQPAPLPQRPAPAGASDAFAFSLDGIPHQVTAIERETGSDGAEKIHLTIDGIRETVELSPSAAAEGQASAPHHAPSGPGDVTTSMPGTVVEVLVEPGQSVQQGEPLLVIEAMKMESEITAPVAGTVTAICVTKGERIDAATTLVSIAGAD